MADIQESGNPTGAAGANQTVSGEGSDKLTSQVQSSSDLQSIVNRLEALERLDGNPREAQRRRDKAYDRLERELKAIVDRLERGEDTPATSAPAVVGNHQTPAKPDLQAIVEQLGLDPNGPEVTDLLRSESDPTMFAVKAAQVAIKRASVQPNPGSVMQTGGPVAPVGDNIGTLTAELNSLFAEPTKNAVKIAAVQAKLEAALRGS